MIKMTNVPWHMVFLELVPKRILTETELAENTEMCGRYVCEEVRKAVQNFPRGYRRLKGLSFDPYFSGSIRPNDDYYLTFHGGDVCEIESNGRKFTWHTIDLNLVPRDLKTTSTIFQACLGQFYLREFKGTDVLYATGSVYKRPNPDEGLDFLRMVLPTGFSFEGIYLPEKRVIRFTI